MRNLKEADSSFQMCPSSLEWDRLFLKQLPRSEAERIRKHIDSCPVCMHIQEERNAAFTWIAEQPSAQDWIRQRLQEEEAVNESAVPQKSLYASLFAHWRSLSLAVCSMGLIWFFLESPETYIQPSTSRMKSQTVHTPVKRQTVPSAVAKNLFSVRMLHIQPGQTKSSWTHHQAVLEPGALIQFELHLYKALHVAVLSINQKGVISAFVPLSAKKSIYKPQGKQSLPYKGSLELDDYIGLERIFVLFSKHAFSMNTARKHIRQAYIRARRNIKKMQTLPDWRCHTLLIRKAYRPLDPAHP